LMVLEERDLSVLACPRCAGGLETLDGLVGCTRCRARYEVQGDVVDLLPWSGGAPGAEWAQWRARLDRLQEWRRHTWDGSRDAASRQKVADDLAVEFFRFARVPEAGPVLDVGCGGGDLRRFVPRRRYYGVDPLAGVAGAPRPEPLASESVRPVLVRGVGERLPIADAVFETVLLCETLDHVQDPLQVIREARRVLKPSGVLAVMQSVHLAAPPPPLHVRLRAGAGRIRSSLRRSGKPTVTDSETKVRVLRQEDLASMLNAEMVVEAGATSGSTMFLRALKQEPSAPRIPKRAV